MKDVNRIINESGVSKVKIAKYLGVSRQMLYNYLSLKSFNDLPKEKQNKLLSLFKVSNSKELADVKVDDSFIEGLENDINAVMIGSINKESIANLKGLNKKEQELLTDIFNLLKEKIVEKQDNAYITLKYLYHYLQAMEQVPELKYILAYVSKSNVMTPVMEFAYDEDKQYTFEGILYTAMTLYTNGSASRSKVSESHKKWEKSIDSKKEDALSRTQELNSFKNLALSELGYTAINESNAKEVFEKIAEIMSRKF